MDSAHFIEYLVSFMMIAVIVAGIPLAIATLLGLIVSIFQATTQIQDQTLSQTIKIMAIVAVLLTMGGTLLAPLLTNTEAVMQEINRIGR